MEFSEEKKSLKSEVEISELIIRANTILKEYNWLFFHPYTQVFKIESIIRKQENNELNQEYLSDFFTKEFYDLNSTLSFIDGIFSRSAYVEPFTYFIEHSLILFFERDYGGAINLILPSIEGIFAKYLTEARRIDLNRSRYESLKKTLFYLKSDIIISQEKYFDEHNSSLNKQQADYLKALEKRRLDNWFLNIDSFFTDSLFANSNSLNNGQILNRHSIFHALSLNIYHTKENYIKLFNALIFIAWVFLLYENKSLLANDADSKSLTKRLQYESLIKKSEKLLVHKHCILKEYRLYNKKDLKDTHELRTLSKNLSLKYRLLLKLRNYLDTLYSKWDLRS